MGTNQKRTISSQCGRLVILLVLLSVISSCYEIPDGSSQTLKSGGFGLKSKEEILAVADVYLYSQPVFYLFFLPGPLLLIAVMLLKKYKILKITILLALLLAFPVVMPEDNYGIYLDNGIKAYLDQNLDLALINFTEAEKKLQSNYLLEYNIALCYYKLEKPGYVIHALKKAILLNAGDMEVRKFLKLVETENGLNSQVNTNPYYHPNIPFVIMLIFFNISFAVFLLLRKYKKGQVVIIFIFCILLALAAAGALIQGLVYMHQPIGVIVQAQASIKQIPENSGKERIKLKEGTIVRVLWKMPDYVFISTNIGLQGWVKQESILLD